MVPISKPVVVALRRYLRWGRPKLTGVPTDDAAETAPLLVGRTGRRLTENGLCTERSGAPTAVVAVLDPWGSARSGACLPHTPRNKGSTNESQDNMGHENARVTKLYAGATRIDTARAALSGKTPLTLLRTRGRR